MFLPIYHWDAPNGKKGKNKLIAYFNLELSNKSIVKVKAYDEIADYCYKELKEDDKIFICGKLNEKGEITINDVKKL